MRDCGLVTRVRLPSAPLNRIIKLFEGLPKFLRGFREGLPDFFGELMRGLREGLV